MMPSTTAAFVKTVKNCCSNMGWNQGAMGITKFPNQQGVTINIVKNYGQINEPTLKDHLTSSARQREQSSRCAPPKTIT